MNKQSESFYIRSNAQDIYTLAVEQGIEAIKMLASCTPPVLRYLAIGIGLGILGTAAVACAIPILACITSLP